ncbi:MAG TPA: DUF512 domain-containing protein [Clostridia bacterium]|nr:DUF512 domain-containing protein [Clostridia bacterium]
MAHRIAAVEPGSIADQCGIRPGDLLLSINGKSVVDQIDYQAFIAVSRLELLVEKPNGSHVELTLEKDEAEPLGLTFEQTLMSKPRVCRNRCVFCFVDQLPPGMRKTLYVKDDDWRLSLMMGNFVTLTNVDGAEMKRILRRKASPLFISVHATDPQVRARMMGNPSAAGILEHLQRLAEGRIRFHCQVVLCPGINDGAVLEQTLSDLAALHPYAVSVALVPVGLTRFRQKLAQLTPFDARFAEALLLQVEARQADFIKRFGTAFVFAADEFYCLSGHPLPPDEAYEEYPQIENGVGLLRTFEREFVFAYEDPTRNHPAAPRKYVLPTGVSAAPFLRKLLDEHPIPGVEVDVRPIVNHAFGEAITVAGLLTGKDIVEQLRGARGDAILINESMLSRTEPKFLDDLTLEDLQSALKLPVQTIPCDGAAFLYRLTDTED